MSLRMFLAKAKASLRTALAKQQTVALVVGNESADLDSATSAICYAYLCSANSPDSQRVHVPILNIPFKDVGIRPELLALLPHAGLRPSDLITLDDLPLSEGGLQPLNTTLILTDHNSVDGPLAAAFSDRTVGCIDHHVDERKVPSSASPRIITRAGSCTSLVIDHFRDEWASLSRSAASSGAATGQDDATHRSDDVSMRRAWDAQLARLAIASILIDTVDLTADNKTEDVDRQMVDHLLSKIALAPPDQHGIFNRSAFFNSINDAKSDLELLSPDDVLRKDYKQWAVGSQQLGISSVVKPLSWLEHKTSLASTSLAHILKQFAEARDLDVMAIMTASAGHGQFSRELLLCPCKDSLRNIINTFESVAGEEFELNEEAPHHSDEPFKIWSQGNLGASRKQVGPRLREVMAAQREHRI